VIEKLRENNIQLQPLRKFILSIQKGVEPGSENYRDEGKSFIRVSNLSKYGFTDRDQKYLSEELYQQLRETYEPKQGDFLLTKDATPGIAYVVKEQIEGIISSGILRLQINDSEINKEYLALCINSIVGKMQVERDCGGSVILHWIPEQVKRLQIPLLPLSIQQEIASLVQQSHEARKKAKELLEIAKRAVEIAIENSEAEALDYISKHA
jgi:type I restriction enzyme S subunit